MASVSHALQAVHTDIYAEADDPHFNTAMQQADDIRRSVVGLTPLTAS